MNWLEHSSQKDPGYSTSDTRRGRVVVTGGAGFLGCNIVDRLAAEGRQVLVFDSLSRPGVEKNALWLLQRHPSLVELVRADVRDSEALAASVKGTAAVIHLAAQVAVTTSIADPIEDFEINARGTLNLLEAVRKEAPDAPVLFASTNKVYGEVVAPRELERRGMRYALCNEALATGIGVDAPLSFCSPYGCSKGVADQYVLDYARVYGLRSAALRMSCIFGPRQFGNEDQGWVAHFLYAAMAGRPITIYGDGYQVRDVLYVGDAVEAYVSALAAIDQVAGKAFNIGGGPRHTLSLRELLRILNENGYGCPEVFFGASRPSDQPWYVTDNSAFTKATGWRAQTGVEEGLKALADWVGANVAGDARRKAEIIA